MEELLNDQELQYLDVIRLRANKTKNKQHSTTIEITHTKIKFSSTDPNKAFSMLEASTKALDFLRKLSQIEVKFENVSMDVAIIQPKDSETLQVISAESNNQKGNEEIVPIKEENLIANFVCLLLFVIDELLVILIFLCSLSREESAPINYEKNIVRLFAKPCDLSTHLPA